jgi:hypothetical protein
MLPTLVYLVPWTFPVSQSQVTPCYRGPYPSVLRHSYSKFLPSKMRTLRCFETSGTKYPVMRRRTPEQLTPHTQRRGKTKNSHNFETVFLTGDTQHTGLRAWLCRPVYATRNSYLCNRRFRPYVFCLLWLQYIPACFVQQHQQLQYFIAALL